MNYYLNRTQELSPQNILFELYNLLFFLKPLPHYASFTSRYITKANKKNIMDTILKIILNIFAILSLLLIKDYLCFFHQKIKHIKR